MYFGSWGSYSINDVSAFLPVFFDGGATITRAIPTCRRRWSRSGSTINGRAQGSLFGGDQQITEQAYWVPLHTYVTTYGHAKQLDFTPYPDELPRFYLAKWK